MDESLIFGWVDPSFHQYRSSSARAQELHDADERQMPALMYLSRCPVVDPRLKQRRD
jgi:hypothetical protein